MTSALAQLPSSAAILDCELVYLAPTGHVQFGPLIYGGDRIVDGLNVFAFDLLHINGRDLLASPLQARRKLLASLIERTGIPCLHLVADFEDGRALFAAAEAMELEGIVSKRRDAPYRSGSRPEWLKMKTPSWRQEHSERWKLFERK